MATAFRIRNNLNQVLSSLVKDDGNFVHKRISPREVFDVLEEALSPVMVQQIQNGLLTITETFDPGPGVPTPNGLTDDQKAAVEGSNTPSATNPFATMADVTPGFEQPTKLLFVDPNRIDVYIQDGSLERPYKTLAAACAAATNRSTIVVVGCNITSDAVLPNNVNLFGLGVGITTITGNITTGTSNCHLRDLSIHGNINLNGKSSVTNVYCTGAVTITEDCQSFNFTIKPSTAAVTALTSSGSLVTFNDCTIESSGAVNTIVHTAGKLVLNATQINGNDASLPVVESTGGMFVSQLSFIINSGGGNAVDCDNGATTAPNAVVDTLIAGDIVAGTAAIIADAVYGSGSVTGSAILNPVTGSH